MTNDQNRSWMVPFASVAAFVMLAQLVAGRATREALFLANFEADDLPYAMAAAGVLSVAGSIPAAKALAHFGPGRVVPFFFALSTLLFTVEWLLAHRAPHFVAVMLYLHLAAASTLLVSGFWAILNERFDPHSAKGGLARVASFATAGGMLGGLLSERIGVLFGLDMTLIVMAGMHGFCALLVGWIGRFEALTTEAPAQEESELSGLGAIRSAPYLKLLVATTVTFAILDAPLDFAIRAGAAGEFDSGKELIRFFGFYYTAVGVATFLMQTTLTQKVIARFGIGTAMASMPVMVVVTGGAALISPVLAAFVALRGTTSVLTNSVYRTGFELLYTPLPLRLKRPAKPVVDVGGDGLGDVLGAGLVLAIISAWPVGQLVGVTAAAIGLAFVLIWLLIRLQRAYREQLTENLEGGNLQAVVVDGPAPDVTHSHIQLDRSAIRARLHEMGLPGSPSQVSEEGSTSEWIQALSDSTRAQGAAQGLREKGVAARGPLLEALADSDRPDLAKLFLPGLLERIPDASVLEGLLSTMAKDDFEVRFRSARAAVRIVQKHTELTPAAERVLETVRDELRNSGVAPPVESVSVTEDRTESVLISDYPNLPVARRLEHVLTLLALECGTDLMRSVLLGLYSENPAFLGNALEYLDSSLPEDLRREFPEVLGGRLQRLQSPTARERAARDVEAELLRQAQTRILGPGFGPGDPKDESN